MNRAKNKIVGVKLLIVYWFPPLIWMVFLFPTNDTLTVDSTSHILVPIIKWLFPNADPVIIDSYHILVRKIIHFLDYVILAFLVFRALRMGRRTWQWKWIPYTGVITILYSSLDEFLQIFISSRTGSFSDLIIDTAGAFFALGIITLARIKNSQAS